MRQLIEAQARSFILKLYEYFERESQNGGPLLSVNRVGERVAAALGVGRLAVSNAIREKYGTSGMEDNKRKTPNRKRRKKETASKTVISDDSEDDQPLLINKKKVSGAGGLCGKTVNITKESPSCHMERVSATADTVSENRGYLTVPHKLGKTDYKRHSFFTITHSDDAIIADTVKNTESQQNKSVLCKNDSHSDSHNSKARINLDALNSLTSTESWNNESVLEENEMEAVYLNLNPSSDSSNLDPTIDLDALNELVDPESLLATQDTVMTDDKIPETHDNKMNEDNSTLHRDKINCFVIKKSQNEPAKDLAKPSSSRQKLTDVGASNKSIAKADFQIGRLKVRGAETGTEKQTISPEIRTQMPITSNIDVQAIRNHVKDYHTQNQWPTIRTLLKSLNDAGLFSGNKLMLMEIIADMGFKFNRKAKF